MPTKQLAKTGYQKLLEDLAAIHDRAMKEVGAAVDGIVKKAYWEIGQRIVEVEQKGDGHAPYGAHLLEKISEDLSKSGRKGFSVINLRNMRRVYTAFSIRQLTVELTWTHFVALASIKDKKQRLAYQKKAVQGKWIVDELREVLKKDGVELQGDSDDVKMIPAPVAPQSAPVIRLPEMRGVVGLAPVVSSATDTLDIDLGFKIYQSLPSYLMGKVKPGSILLRGAQRWQLLKSMEASRKVLYTYSARLDKVIDADTPKVIIDLGFGLTTRKKLRLRKINAPEIDTKRGQEAKAYVEHVLKSISTFVIKTYSTDIYDRYLVDIFYVPPTETAKNSSQEHDPSYIAARGTLLNQELIDQGLADMWLTIEPEELAFLN